MNTAQFTEQIFLPSLGRIFGAQKIKIDGEWFYRLPEDPVDDSLGNRMELYGKSLQREITYRLQLVNHWVDRDTRVRAKLSLQMAFPKNVRVPRDFSFLLRLLEFLDFGLANYASG